MITVKKHPLPKTEFEALAKEHDLNAVSIYIPMHKKGKEQNMHLTQALLHQAINEVRKTLEKHEVHQLEIEKYLQPLISFLDRIEVFRNPAEGLAIFLDTKNGMRYYKLPITFEPKTYVSGHFYLLPLLPLYHNDGLYYLLEISQDYVRLYEASHYSFKEVNLESFVPKQLEDAVGYDFKQKHLQFRSGHAMHGASFHGHGEGKDDERNELLRFFRMLHTGVKKVIKNTNTPIMLACTDRLHSLYLEANPQNNVYDQNISGDPEFKNNVEKHQKSWELIEKYFYRPVLRKLNQFEECYHTPKTAYEINNIVSAALDGKVDTLFIAQGSDLYGTYDTTNRKVKLDSTHEVHNASLTNLAAIRTFEQGGQVYFLPSQQMPVKESSMNALFRFG